MEKALRLLPKIIESRVRTKIATIKIVRAHKARSKTNRSPAELADMPSILMSLKVVPPDRLSILKATLRQLRLALGHSRIHVFIDDASEPAVASEVREAFEALPMPITYENSSRHMTQSYLHLLAQCHTQFCYLQFDDQVTTNLSPRFLAASCEFLERYGRYVPVVSATWPTAVEVKPGSIRVTTYEVGWKRRRSLYKFQSGRWLSPIFVEEINGHSFAVFENFMYGFYFNHVIVPVHDYRSRLQWYVDHVDASSVHRIEVAAARRTMGPFWTHVAVCLDDVAIVDLDFQHTAAALRPVAPTARDVFEALQAGWTIETRHKEVR